VWPGVEEPARTAEPGGFADLMSMFCPVVEGRLDVSGEGNPDGDRLALGPAGAALILGDDERRSKDFKPSGTERKRIFFFCGWVGMLRSGCKGRACK